MQDFTICICGGREKSLRIRSKYRLSVRARAGTLRQMSGLRIWVLLLMLAVCSAQAGEWTLIKRGGRDYVTMQNVAQFYQLNNVSRTGNALSLTGAGHLIRGSIGSSEIFINNLKFILSYPIEDHEGQPIITRMDLVKVIEPILRPSRIPSAGLVDTVVLDPGHGGHDNGAWGPFGYEKTYALDVAFRTRQLLQAMGLKVMMTRTSDEFIPLEGRVNFANRFKNALFIAIHFNSGQSAATGVETYTLAPRGVPSMAADGPRLSDLNPCPDNINDPENMALACAAHASMVSATQMYDRGIKRARFVVIRDITVPGVLVEGGFLSNASDARRIATPEYRQTLAAAIARAVRNYRNAVGSTALAAQGGSQPSQVDAKANFNSSPNDSPNEPTVVTPTTH